MKLLANYHTHCKLCNHAVGMPDEYIKEAIRLGMKEIGISDHGPVDKSFMSEKDYYRNLINRNMSLDDFYNIYLKNIQEAINKYSSQIKIYKGLECEFLYKHEEYYRMLKGSLDYMNLGIHFFENNGKIYNTYADVNYETIYYYLDTALRGIRSGIFKIFVHPDVFMFGYSSINGKREWDDNCDKVARLIIEETIKNNVYLELNCQGIKNSQRKKIDGEYRYPYSKFWEIVKEYKEAKVIIGADAHTIESLSDEDIKTGYNMLEKIGITVESVVDFK